MLIPRPKFTWFFKAYDKAFKWYHLKRRNDFRSPTIKSTGEFRYIDRDDLKIPLIKFSQPLKDEFGRQLNANNILFCVGPQQSGKTWLIKSAAAEMTENKPVIFDFQQYYTLQCLEKQLVDLLQNEKDQLQIANKEKYLPSRIIKLIECLQNRNICLLFLNFDSLFQRYPYDKKLYDFLDKLILTYINLSGIRNKIPLILESENCQFFNRDLFEYLHLDQYELTTNDVNHVPEIYNQFKQHNPEVEYRKFKNKIYSVYGRPECAQLLDDQTIDQSLIETMLIIKKNKGQMFTGRHFADVRLLEHPLFIALQNVGILHHPRYVSCLQLAQPFYLEFVHQWLKEKGVSRLDEIIRYRDEGVVTKYFRMDAKRIQIRDYQNEPRAKQFYDDETGQRPYHLTWTEGYKTGTSVK